MDNFEYDKRSELEHCINSDFKYYIFYITGYNYTFPGYRLMSDDNAVSINSNIIIKLNIETYL